MGEIEKSLGEMWRLIGAALLLAVVCAVAALMALQADAQPPAPAARPDASAQPADEIPDDPTVAPDRRQKADDNVSFPVDI